MDIHYGSVPFDQQVAYFNAKTPMPSTHWADLQREMHDTTFVVAGAVKADLLTDLHEAMSKAHEQGTTLAEFRRDFADIVAKHGWTGWTGEGSAEGFAWRTRVIYETNLRTSYQAGRWQQIQAVKATRPYLIYKHSHAVITPRAEHLAWDGLIVPIDSAWVKSHYPPNGYGCQCTMFTLSERDLQRLGKPIDPNISEWTDPGTGQHYTLNPPDDGTYHWKDPKTGDTHTFPTGIQPYWDYAPGASLSSRVRAQIERKMEGLPKAIAGQLQAEINRLDLSTPAITETIPMTTPIAPYRQAWPQHFPPVILNASLGDAARHPGYQAAKGGDIKAATLLARDLISTDAVTRLGEIIADRKPLLIPVHAEESVSINRIPLAYAIAVARKFNLSVELNIVQSAKVGRTGSDGFARLALPPPFAGKPSHEARYAILFDDTLTQGGTLANLRGFVAQFGIETLAATTLTGKKYSSVLAISADTLITLRGKYRELEYWWRSYFGYGFDAFTESEARYLINSKKDADFIRNRILAERQAGFF